MKAAVLHAKHDIRYEEVPMPKIRDGEALIRVRAVGICGSDIPRVNADAAHYYPIILGHEFSGEIAEMHCESDMLRVGTRVTAAPLIPCFKCEDCQRGDFALCRYYSFIGSRIPGAFAEYVAVPINNIIPFSSDVSFEQGAFFEPSTVAYHGLTHANFCGGGDVAVLGGGTIGYFTAQWARILGARSVTVFDKNPARLELALKCRADHAINTLDEDSLSAADKITRGRGFTYIFETAGQNATMELAFKLAANRAKICFIGTSSKNLNFDWKTFELMNRKEFTLTGSWMSYDPPFPGQGWSATAECFASGELIFDDALIYKTFALQDAGEAFKLFSGGEPVNGKVMLINN